MASGSTYFEKFIVPANEKDKADAAILKEAIGQYKDGGSFTIHGLIQNSPLALLDMKHRQIYDAVLRLSKAEIVTDMPPGDGNREHFYRPVPEFDPKKTYTWILLEHTRNKHKFSMDETRIGEAESKVIAEYHRTSIIHASELEPEYSITKKMLMEDLGVKIWEY